MAMTQEEKIEIADMVRSRDRFGPVSEEELAALPGKETELWIRTKNGKTVHVFEERPENLPEQAALLLKFSWRWISERPYRPGPQVLLLGHGTTKLPGMGY